MSQLNIKKSEDANFTTYFLDGSINEDFAQFQDAINRDKSIRFDFSKVVSINSIGIRNWIHWIHNHPGTAYHFKNCPVCIIDQINNVKDFMPTGTTIESFYVPYYCEESGEEKHELYILNRDYEFGEIPKTKVVKDSNGLKMELDVYPQKYFKFLLR